MLPDNYILSNINVPLLDSETQIQPGDEANALQVRNGIIVWVGRAGAQDAPLDAAGRSAVLVKDLGGATVLPGFIDNHVHLAVTGDLASQPRLNGMNAAQIREVLRQRHAEITPRETLRGYGWDYPTWPDPHRSFLDEISTDRPIVLFQFSGHAACVNGAMLRKLGIDRNTPDPPDGSIERDEYGEPTGILREGASRPLHVERMRRVNRDRRLVEHLLEAGQDVLVQHGITSVGDNTWYAGSAFALTRLRRRGRLRCRVSSWSLGSAPRERLLMRFAPYDREYVRRGPVKYFLDGAFSSHTALLLEPYIGEPNNHGTPVLHGQALQQQLLRLTRRGRQGAFHAIGDAAVRDFLDAVENLAARGEPTRECRHRLEHCQLVAAGDMTRLARLGVLVAAQPHALGSPEKDKQLLGAERAERAYPYRSLLDSGVALSFGSDSPAEAGFEPLEGIRLACLRPGPEQITVREAIQCYTRGSAYAEGTENWKGSIAVGKAADLAVLSHDPLELDRT
ncbi:MAG: amidohydrolase, partial [Spirochaetia bacterium]